MLCKCHWIVLYTVHFTAFCLGGAFFPGHGVHTPRLYIDTVSCHRCAINGFALSVDGAALSLRRHHFIVFGRCHGGTNWYGWWPTVDGQQPRWSAQLCLWRSNAGLLDWTSSVNCCALTQTSDRPTAQRDRLIAQMCWSRATCSWLVFVVLSSWREPMGRQPEGC